MFGGFSTIDISASGLSAERLRMEITANNIANAGTTQTESGNPYRRQNVVFAAAMDPLSKIKNPNAPHGVHVVGIEGDPTEFPMVFNPGHPHANAEGFVQMPNVQIPNEMVDLITASRSYEANSRAISLYREMVETTLSLLQGGQ